SRRRDVAARRVRHRPAAARPVRPSSRRPRRGRRARRHGPERARPMSDLLGIGASALKAYQGALSAIGENVANAQTPGFARRRVILQEATVVGSGDIAYRAQITFNGVYATGVARAW